MSTCFVRFVSSNTLNYDSSTKWIYDNDNSRCNTLLIQDCSKWICQELNSESPALTLLICHGEAEDEAAAAWGPLAATAAAWIWRKRWLPESLNHRFLLESIDAGLVDERLTKP